MSLIQLYEDFRASLKEIVFDLGLFIILRVAPLLLIVAILPGFFLLSLV